MPEEQEGRTFWARVRQRLEELGLPATQNYAARLAGVKQPSVALWNKPNGYPELKTTVRIAKRLKCCVEWLYTGRGEKIPGPPDDPLLAELKQFWSDLSENTKGDLVAMARLHAELRSASPPRPPTEKGFQKQQGMPGDEAVDAPYSRTRRVRRED